MATPVTVTVLTHNRKRELATTLRKLREELDYPGDDLELIVVDNGSSDGTADMLRHDFPGVRVIENENVGASGWTRGFEAGQGDYFLILDDDCYIEDDSLARAVAAAEEQGADLVSFRVISSYDPEFEFNSHYNVGLLSFWGCAALISRRAVERLGGFDPNIFIWANELEFTIRLLDAGYRHLYLPEVTAVHMKQPPEGHSAAVYRIHMRHLGYVVTKLLRRRDAALVLARLGLKLVLGLPRHPSRWRAAPAFVAGALRGLRSRQPVRAAVSRLYRSNLRDFSSPFLYLDAAGLLRAARGSEGIAGHIESRHERFFASRPALYPGATGWLDVPR